MGEAKRWCFTINNPTDQDKFWCVDGQEDHPNDLLVNIEYFILQEERGEQGTLHWQGFMILKKKKRLSWLKNNINPRAHWEIARGTNEEARDYCRKEDTYTGGLRKEYGQLPKRAAKKASERLEHAMEVLDSAKETYIRPRDIDSQALLQPGMCSALKMINQGRLGPYRPNLRILCLIGPPGTGKSYAIHQAWPDAGTIMPGNCGIWACNPDAEVIFFEEFQGQVPLNRMLTWLDPYPNCFEIKGDTVPEMAKIIVLTSNIPPNRWYPIKDDDPGYEKKMEAVHALWDRIGYSDGSYIPVRQTGKYIEAPTVASALGQTVQDYVYRCRDMFKDAVNDFKNHCEQLDDDSA